MGKIYRHILCVRTIDGAVNVSNGRKDIQENGGHLFLRKFIAALLCVVVIIYLRHMVNVQELEISPRVNRYVCKLQLFLGRDDKFRTIML